MKKILTSNSQLDIVALITARSGSKGIKDKNIKLLNKHPLISYSIIAAKLSRLIKDVFVTTDSIKYAKISKRYGANTPFLRPKAVSLDKSIDKEFFLHFIDWCKNHRNKIPDLIVHLRPTTPLRNFKLIDQAIQNFIGHSEATSLRSCQLTSLTPYKMFFEENYFLKPFLNINSNIEPYNAPRQNFPNTYLPNGYVDIIRPKILKETGMLHGNKILLYLTEKIADIDDVSDLKYAEELLKSKKYLSLIKNLDKVTQ